MKKWIAAFLSLLCILSISGCGQQNETSIGSSDSNVPSFSTGSETSTAAPTEGPVMQISDECSLSACAGQSSAPKSDAPTNPTESGSSTGSTLPAESIAPTETPTASDESTEPSSETATEPVETASAERKIKMTVDGQEISIVLYDTPTANALYEALPMELNFSDYNGTEKIAYPPDTLPTEGEPDGCDPDVGDLCLYAPWGNLCIFYQDFRYSQSLIKLGHVESGMDVLAGIHPKLININYAFPPCGRSF